MIIGGVRVSRIRALELGRQHTADQFNVDHVEIGRCVGAIKHAVIGDRHTFGAAAVSDPDDPI